MPSSAITDHQRHAPIRFAWQIRREQSTARNNDAHDLLTIFLPTGNGHEAADKFDK
jgi:hypothetical protein